MIDVLAERAAVFKEKEGQSPCLFIDGVALLAKDNREAFIKSIEIVKKHAFKYWLYSYYICLFGKLHHALCS